MARNHSETDTWHVESTLSIEHGYNTVMQHIDSWLLSWSNGESAVSEPEASASAPPTTWLCQEEEEEVPKAQNGDFIQDPEPEPSPPASPGSAGHNVTAEDMASPPASLSSAWYNVAHQPVLERESCVIFRHEGDKSTSALLSKILRHDKATSPRETAGSKCYEHRYEPAPELEPQRSPAMKLNSDRLVALVAMKLNSVSCCNDSLLAAASCSSSCDSDSEMEGSPQLKSLRWPICSSSKGSSDSDVNKYAYRSHLLQEIIDLTHECTAQDVCVRGLSNFLKMQMFAYSGILNEHSAELQEIASRLDAEEERLVFLEDNLDFAREQLRSNLADFGATAAHGLPEACMPDSVGYPSWKYEAPKSSFKSDSSLESCLSLGSHGRRDA